MACIAYKYFRGNEYVISYFNFLVSHNMGHVTHFAIISNKQSLFFTV